jgi:hypothetical protein
VLSRPPGPGPGYALHGGRVGSGGGLDGARWHVSDLPISRLLAARYETHGHLARDYPIADPSAPHLGVVVDLQGAGHDLGSPERRGR